MRVICAWCGKIIKQNGGSRGTSHGICEKCKKQELDKIRKGNHG